MIPPSPDQIEVTVFGPGYGESILIHIGAGEWVAVDSCINPDTRQPAILDYLHESGLSPDCIKLIIVSHWHDDHIRGLSKIVESCQNADLFLSAAFTQHEFISLISSYGFDTTITSKPGTQEINDTISLLKSRNNPPKHALENRILWERKAPERDYCCEIRALSPSDRAILSSNLQIAKLIPHEKTVKSRLLPLTPNYASVVLWVNINNHIILLGADLENTQEDGTGWAAILSSKIRTTERAKIFKIPHHGSSNADHEGVWRQMIDKNPLLVLTPHQHGKTSLPKDPDINRLCEKSRDTFITAQIKNKKVKSEHKIDQIMEDYIINRKLVHSNFGYVQFRHNLSAGNSNWEVKLFKGAKKLCAE